MRVYSSIYTIYSIYNNINAVCSNCVVAVRLTQSCRGLKSSWRSSSDSQLQGSCTSCSLEGSLFSLRPVSSECFDRKRHGRSSGRLQTVFSLNALKEVCYDRGVCCFAIWELLRIKCLPAESRQCSVCDATNLSHFDSF